MKNTKTTQKRSRLISIKNIIFIIIVFLVLVSAARSISSLTSSRSRVQIAEERRAAIGKEQEKLKDELSVVQSDFFQEKLARDKLGLAREGEVVIVLPDEALLRRLSPRVVEEEKRELPEPNWKRWASLFFEI